MRFIRYFCNLFLSIDQLINAILGGDPDETVSSRIGRIKRANGGAVPRFRLISRTTDKCLEFVDPGHSIDSIEEDEGSAGVIDTPNNLKEKKWTPRT